MKQKKEAIGAKFCSLLRTLPHKTARYQTRKILGNIFVLVNDETTVLKGIKHTAEYVQDS